MVAARSSKPLHVLCLHGLCSHSRVLQHQLSSLRFVSQGQLELDFLDAPMLFPLSDVTGNSDTREDAAADMDVLSLFPDISPRCWYDPLDDNSVDTAIRKVARTVADNKDGYDVLLGFSQGASLVCLLSLLLEKGTLEHRVGHPVPRWSCAVMLCGIETEPLQGLQHDFSAGIGMPTVHLIGQTDHAYGHRSRYLLHSTLGSCTPHTAAWIREATTPAPSTDKEQHVREYKSQTHACHVLVHPHGHRVPPGPRLARRLAEAILDAAEHASSLKETVNPVG